MSQAGRVLVSLVIWIGVFSLMGAAFTSVTGPISHANSGELLGLTAILVIGAAIGTAAVWAGANDNPGAEHASSKTKRVRPSRVQRLIEDLEDDEVYELEALLLAREDQAELRRRQS